MKTMENKIYKKVCEDCGKEITSLSESQCNHNFQVHLLSCKRNDEKNERNI